jgi:tRNA A-37 threonylcarbamoyl transferase component Bud32
MGFRKKKKIIKLSKEDGRHEVYLDTNKDRVKKKFIGDLKWTRLLQDFNFNKYDPFSPAILKVSKEFKYFYQQYIKHSRTPTLQELLKEGLTKKIAKRLSVMHNKEIVRSIKEDHQKEESVDYVAVLKKYLESVKDKKLAREVFRQKGKMKVLNEEEDFALIHGDLAFHNILLQKTFFWDDIYFIDGEAELVKTKRSVGNKYIDLSFFIAHNLLMKSYAARLNGEMINHEVIEKAVYFFLDNYAHHNGISQKKLVKAMALYFIRKTKEVDTLWGEVPPVIYLLKEMDKEMCLCCLKYQKLDKVLNYFFEKYNVVKEVNF